MSTVLLSTMHLSTVLFLSTMFISVLITLLTLQAPSNNRGFSCSAPECQSPRAVRESFPRRLCLLVIRGSNRSEEW